MADARKLVPTVRAIPWVLVVTVTAEVTRAAREHWGDLPAKDRKRLQELLAKSKGRPDHLDPREREELLAIARKVDAVGFAKRVGPLLAGVAVKAARR